MPDIVMPEVIQVEAYYKNRCILIRNDRVAGYCNWVKQQIDDDIQEVSSFPAFLDATRELTARRKVVVAIGDSRTGTVANWPWFLSKDYDQREGAELVVVNFGGWVDFIESHFGRLEFYLPWLTNHSGPAEVAVIAFGSIGDMLHKQMMFETFMDKGGQELLSNAEKQLLSHRLGHELERLVRDTPADWQDVSRWIARRILAAIKTIDQLCLENKASFFAILEPNAYPDFSPGYQGTLRRLHSNDKVGPESFDEWCRLKGFPRSTADCGPVNGNKYPLRPILDHLRNLWSAQALKSSNGKFIDWSELFINIDECYFTEYDALHFNERGSRLIAKSVAKILSGQN